MKNVFLIPTILLFSGFVQAQDKPDSATSDKNGKLLKELSESACKCIDSIPIQAVSKDTVASRIHRCINEQAGAYQMGKKLLSVDLTKADKNNEINVEMNLDTESKEYKADYYEMERYLMDNCASVKTLLGSNDLRNEKSVSTNREAVKFYSLGQKETDKENWKMAVEYYKKAVQIDPNFAFAYDNLGVAYRHLDDFDNAIDAYEKSLKIDPNGITPLQNIAIVYQFKKEYKKAIKSYEKLSQLDPNNPEVFYGIGQTYVVYLKDYEKGLDNLCKAYNIYVDMKSPYRTDAEKLISMVFTEMKKQGNEAKFNEILKNNNISPN